jgi:serine/threonine-protein kinase
VREPHELHTVIVLAPRVEHDRTNVHLAEGFHEELLRRLAQRPRIRVLPRVQATDAETTIELVVGDELEVMIRRGASAHRLGLPLSVHLLAITADAIANLVAGALGEPVEPTSLEATELWLRARHTMQRGISGYEPAFELIERAHQLAPDDPRIAATLALACVRVATFDPNDQHGWFGRARDLVREALMSAPELAETHVAAAHLELHTGEAAAAAMHFRRAIACSRYIAEGHEGLGRLLLEAGFLDVAMARLDEALAIAPHLSTVRWDIARAWALEGRWDKADPMIAELRTSNDRVVARARFACWRGDAVTLESLRVQATDNRRAFNPQMLESLYGVVVLGGWQEHRDALIAKGLDTRPASKRAHALYAQLVAEIAGFAGDGPTAMQLLEHAASSGLFDLHWLDRCPLLEPARKERGYAMVRAKVKARADAILDALYGDLELGALSDTVAV